MTRLQIALASGLVLLALLGRGNAEPQQLTDPNQDIAVPPAAGPWMICAASYSGPKSAELAREFCLTLRKDFRLPAYTFNRGLRERLEQQEHLDKIKKLSPDARVRIIRIEDQYAVLVGGYADIETARKTLDGLKKTEAPSSWRKWMPVLTVLTPTKEDPNKTQQMYENPLLRAFVVRNPTVPVEKQEQKPDAFLKKLNANEKYSLLRCGKPWTLAVKEFQGPAVLQESQAPSTSFLQKIGLGSRSSDVLTASALQAQELARVLRELKFDAYVLHTRGSSVVSVGGYDGPNDPNLQQMQKTLATLKFQGTPIQLFTQPLPMQVPQF